MADAMRKSTPISAAKCPRQALSIEEHTVTDNEDGTYTCTCGKTWKWDDQTHYETAEAPG